MADDKWDKYKGTLWGGKKAAAAEVDRSRYEIYRDERGVYMSKHGRLESPALGGELYFWHRLADTESGLSAESIDEYLGSYSGDNVTAVRELLIDFCDSVRERAENLRLARDSQRVDDIDSARDESPERTVEK